MEILTQLKSFGDLSKITFWPSISSGPKRTNPLASSLDMLHCGQNMSLREHPLLILIVALRHRC